MSTVSIVKRCAIVLFIFANGILANPILREEDFTIRIVHTNDMHARFEETSRLSTACTPKDSEEGKCYGGFARIATLVRQAKSEAPTIFLNAGDTYQGTVWYNVYKWRVVSVFMNLLAPDAISLGNHEFDDGVEGLIPFIQNATFPIVTANLDLSEQPDLAATNLKKSTVLEINGRKIGVIGYLTPETKVLASTDNVIFKDEVESIREEVKKLKERGIDILIALGHSGFEADKRIAREVEDIDLVIGGHTNTFLYKGEVPDVEEPEGFYPTEVKQRNGRIVYVVQAYAYTKYLGNLTVSFNARGELTRIEGNPILVDAKVKEAEDVVEVIQNMREPIDSLMKKEIGKTRVLLDGDSKNCRRKECNLGNLICDSIIDHYATEYLSKHGWTNAAIAVQNSGSVRTSITRARDDTVTRGDVINVLPFNNVVTLVNMTGDQILSMLEWSVYHLHNQADTANLHGAFLQYSGLQVTYDTALPSNSRVISVYVRCATCQVPAYDKLENNAVYSVLVNDFIAKGGDGFDMLKDLKSIPLGVTTADVLEQYFQKHSPVYIGEEWRISYIDQKSNSKNDKLPITNFGATYQPIGMTILLPIITWILTR